MLIFLEGMFLCFLMMLVCVVGIADGPVGSVYFYESDVQEKVVELGLTTKEEIKKRSIISLVALLIPMLIFAPLMVYFLNGARGFANSFWQLCIILYIEGLFDRLFIDWYWVSKTKAWYIPGTEDLMPYVPKKTFIRKWVGTIFGMPLIAAILAGILSLF